MAVHRVLVVDDDDDLLEFLEVGFSGHGFLVTCAQSVVKAQQLLASETYDLVLTDVNMKGATGIELCQWMSEHHPETPVVIMTAFASIDSAVSALRSGAQDYIQKPLHIDTTITRIHRVIESTRLQAEVKRLSQVLDESRSFAELIGASSEMQRVFGVLERVSDTHASVLVTGERGAGKELVARSIHERSGRKGGPFIAVNTSAIPENLFERELFGQVATRDAPEHDGLLRQANEGTLFLDELGELPLPIQPKLLRALEDRSVRPVGGNQDYPINIRLVTSTNIDLESAVADGNFRQDLFYRINVVHVRLPPLRSRGKDILLLAQHFLERAARESGKAVSGLQPNVAERLLGYNWPGNVRELRNCIEHAVALTRYDKLGIEDLPARIRQYKPSHVVVASEDPRELLPMHEVERRYITRVLEAVKGNKSLAAKILGFDRKTLYRKLDRYAKMDAASG